MAQTYKQIQKQIEQLQREAEALRGSEIKGVVDRIKVA
ncbi:MAG: H-NS histone family protein, partial [Variovorax sp.]